MAHRRISLSNPRRRLSEDALLAELKTVVDGLAADLATLESQSEAERRDDVTTRESVMNRLKKLSEF